jgi:hypothetical protein
LPLASLPGTDSASLKDCPPSVERAETRRVPLVDFAVHITAIVGTADVPSLNTIRGGCSPDALASPATVLTRTGVPKVRPLSRLVAA